MLPPPPCPHQRKRMLHAEENAVEIDRHLPLPVGERHVDHGTREANPGIVDENVEPAEPCPGLGHDRLPVFLARYVVVVVLALASDGAQFAQQALALLVLQIGCDDLRALARQHQGCGPADAVGGAGHQSDFSFDTPRHASIPFPACGHSAGLLSREQWRARPAPGISWKRFHTLSDSCCSRQIFTGFYLVYRFQNALEFGPPTPERRCSREPCNVVAPACTRHNSRRRSPGRRIGQQRQPRHERRAAHQPGIARPHHASG